MNTKILLLLLRVGLLVGGLTVLYLLIDHAGPEEVLRVLGMAAPWLPLFLVLEALWATWDILLVRNLYGEAGKRVPTWAYVRSALIAYPFLALLPAGRAGAEAARATALARWVSGPRAAAAAAQTQGCGLLGNGIWSFVILVGTMSILSSRGHLLIIGIAANMVLGLLAGVLILRMLRGYRFGGWLGRFSQKLAAGGAAFDQHVRVRRSFLRPVLLAVGGRATQFVQYALYVFALGGVLAVDAGVLAQGIHLVGALLGDLVPNQVGVADGIFVFFAGDAYATFGFASMEAGLAAILSIEMLRRICQIFWSIVGALVPIFWTVRAEDWHTYQAEAVRAEQATEHPVETLAEIASAEDFPAAPAPPGSEDAEPPQEPPQS